MPTKTPTQCDTAKYPRISTNKADFPVSAAATGLDNLAPTLGNSAKRKFTPAYVAGLVGMGIQAEARRLAAQARAVRP